MPNRATPGRRKWTVMVYMAGQNRLFDEMVYALKEMKRAANEENTPVALLAEFSTKWVYRKDSSPTNPATPRRFDIKTSAAYPEGSVASNLVTPTETKPYKNFKEELAQFIAWGVNNYPAEHYMVVFSGDGGGVNSDFLPSLVKPGRKLRAYDLTAVFRRVNQLVPGPKIMFDIVGFDSCMMSMAEIGHGLRKHARLLVGSQGNEDDLGWPFANILKPLTRKPAMTPYEFASNIVDQFNSYYLDYALIANSSASLSVTRLDKMDALRIAVRLFANRAVRVLERDVNDPAKKMLVGLLTHAHWVAQTFRQDQFADIYDFCDWFIRDWEFMDTSHTAVLSELKPIVDACQGIKKVIRADNPANSAVLKSCTVGTRYQHAYGLSLYFPWNKIDIKYHPGDFSEDPPIDPDVFGRDSNWTKFLERYIETSQRDPRPTDFELDPLTPLGRSVDSFLKDPPEGKGSPDLEPEAAKNPPTTWKVRSCVLKPIMSERGRSGRKKQRRAR